LGGGGGRREGGWDPRKQRDGQRSEEGMEGGGWEGRKERMDGGMEDGGMEDGGRMEGGWRAGRGRDRGGREGGGGKKGEQREWRDDNHVFAYSFTCRYTDGPWPPVQSH